MLEGSGDFTDNPSSEVGSNRAKASDGSNNNEGQWRALFEIQNQQIRELIHALKTPAVSSNVILPEFNPDKQDADARSWCATADLCFNEDTVQGGQLIMILSKALKGTASTWLPQITYPGITWPQFKELFEARFVSMETSAATLINLNNERPKERETYAAYASRLITSLLSRWNKASIEQIVVSTVVAHLAQMDTRLQRLAFTTELTTRSQLQQELQAFSFRKRKVSADLRSDVSSEKRMKFETPLQVRCHACGKLGHKQANCRTRKNQEIKKASTPTPALGTAQRSSANYNAITCYKCGNLGHIASRCTTAAGGSSSAAPTAKRVDICEVAQPSSTLSLW